jgi:putative transposase
MAHLAINMVLAPVAGEHPFDLSARVLHIDRSAIATLITIEATPKKPWRMGAEVIIGMLQANEIAIVQLKPPSFMLAMDCDLSEGDRRRRDVAWQRILPIVEASKYDEFFSEDRMGALIKHVAEETGTQKRTLYNLLYRYWTFGSIPNALLPNFYASSGKGKERTAKPGNKLGRPRNSVGVHSALPTLDLSELDKRLLRIGYALYKDGVEGTQTSAYDAMLAKFYCDSISVPGFPEEHKLKPLSECPTLKQFRYWGQKAFDDMVVLKGRAGNRSWEMNHRALRGRSNQNTLGACHRFEIDATIADIYLTSGFNRNWIIGRPVVYVVVDVDTRMIVGVYVGLEGPSWNGARLALLNAFHEKKQFCSNLGIPINDEDWPCHHLPQEICGDRGEMAGVAAEEALTKGMGIEIVLPPPYRPDWKSIVESRFRILNQLTKVHWIPGGVAKRIRERGERDYREDATLNLQEFTKIIVLAILHYNRHSRNPDYLTEEMIAAEISPTPLSLWNWGIDTGLGKSSYHDQEQVRLHLMPKADATVQAGGIHFSGMYYVPDTPVPYLDFARARARGSSRIDVWYDPNVPRHVWVRAPDRTLQRCSWRASETRYENRRLEEIQDMLEIIKTRSPTEQYDERASKVALHSTIEATVFTAAEEKKEAGKPASRAARLGNIKQNRARERDAISAATAPKPQIPAPAAVVTSQPGREGAAVVPTSQLGRDGFGDRGSSVISILRNVKKR